MPETPTLEAVQPSTAQQPSAPVAETKPTTEQGEIKAAPEDANPEGGKGGEQPKADEPKPELTEVEKVKQAMQKRIDRQTAAFKAQQERTRQLEQQFQELSAKVPKPEDDPKPDDYDTYEEYEQARIEKLAERKANERLKQAKEEELKVARERQQQEVARQFAEKENTFRTRTADYDRVAEEAASTIRELAMAGQDVTGLTNMVLEFDNPPEMIYQLGKDTSLIETLVTMPPLRAMRELVKLEEALKASTKVEPEKAPEPIKPIASKGGAKPLHQRSAQDLVAWAKGK